MMSYGHPDNPERQFTSTWLQTGTKPTPYLDFSTEDIVAVLSGLLAEDQIAHIEVVCHDGSGRRYTRKPKP